MLNEARTLPALAAAIEAALAGLDLDWEVVFVDDGSTDDSMERVRELHARDPRWKAISFSRNFGKEFATTAGLHYARGDAVVIMDADLQHPPAVVREFVARWREGYDIVFGQRLDRKTDGLVRRLAARGFYDLFRRISGTTLPEGAGDFRLLDRKVVDALNRFRERVRFNKGLFAWVGYRSVGVPYDVAPRDQQNSRWATRRLWQFAIDGVTSFSTVPLRMWSYLGVFVSLLAFAYALEVIIKTAFLGIDVPGYPSLIVSILFLAGVQLLSLGIIGEYLGRIYEEVKGRPLFLVREAVGIDAPHPIVPAPPAPPL
jgi:glycosyltransferase involved in cell wall biosynthesis